MTKIKNIKLKGLKLSFENQNISFDTNGISEEIDSNLAANLAKLTGYELIADKVVKDIKTDDKVENHEETQDADFEKATIKELKEMLDEKGIEYDSKDKKDDLIKLLK